MGLPRIYENVEALQIYSDTPRTKKTKEKMICELGEDEFWQIEEASLMCMGMVAIPRSLLYLPALKNLSPAARIVYIWLLIKQRILEIAAKAGIKNDEIIHLPIVTARNCEIAKYAGIPVNNVSRIIKSIENAGLIKTKKVKTGGKITGTLYKLPTWPDDVMGYVDIPLKSMITPAWTGLSHSAKWLWLILLSEHCAKKGIKKGDKIVRFPKYEMAYSEIKKRGLKSDKTVRKAIMELEKYGFIYVTHGRYDDDTKQREMNQYQISADHLHIWGA